VFKPLLNLAILSDLYPQIACFLENYYCVIIVVRYTSIKLLYPLSIEITSEVLNLATCPCLASEGVQCVSNCVGNMGVHVVFRLGFR